MKKLVLTTLLGLSTLSANIISLPEVTQEFLQAWTEGSVIELPQGSTLPLHFSLRGDFFSAEGNIADLKIEKTLYVKLEEKALYFSSDLKVWKPMEQFFAGSFGASLQVKDGERFMSFFSELNERG